MPAKISIIGQTFGRWKVIAEATLFRDARGRTQRQSLCRCSCGNEVVVDNGNLRTGKSQSCGCLHNELLKARVTTHGHTVGRTKSRTFACYQHMLERCYNPNCEMFYRYGGRGITVWDGWRASFDLFLEDNGECPEGMEIDRILNWWNYDRGNTKWSTDAEQARGTSRNVNVTVHGVSGCLTDVCKHFGFSFALVAERIRRGYTPEEAFFSPRWKHRVQT